MDAQELNVALQRVRAYLDAGEVKTLISTAYAPTEDRLWGDDLRVLVDALAERAVSPAESLAQPLQQDGVKDERAMFETEIVKHFAFDTGLFKQFDGNTYFSDPLTFAYIGWKAARALAQPSNKLQQASTADVRDRHGRKWEELDALKMRVSAEEEAGGKAFSVTTAEGAPLAGKYTGDEPVRLVSTAWSITGQATPEGAELPPLPGAYYKALDGEVFTPQQMRDYARAVLAASQQAAEPVYQIRDEYEGWDDVDKNTFYLRKDPIEKRILYRAAPPQQVDPTAEARALEAALVKRCPTSYGGGYSTRQLEARSQKDFIAGWKAAVKWKGEA